MIIWTIGTGESGCTDSLQRAPAAAITVRVEGTKTRLVPAYDGCGHYDPDATTRAAHHLRDTITGAAELTMAGTTP